LAANSPSVIYSVTALWTAVTEYCAVYHIFKLIIPVFKYRLWFWAFIQVVNYVTETVYGNEPGGHNAQDTFLGLVSHFW